MTTDRHSSAGDIPKRGVASGFSTGTVFFQKLRRDELGALVLEPRGPLAAAIWPAVIGLVLYAGLWLAGRFLDDGFFTGFFRGGALFIGIVASVMFFLFFTIARKWSPTIRFDKGQNLIHRSEVLTNLLGRRSRVEEMRMKLTEARAIQLCYGGFAEGDGDSSGYDWWQLLVVGAGDPPFRAILAQSSAHAKMHKAGRDIASYLGVPWIDDSDYRAEPVDDQKRQFGRMDDQGTFVTRGSSADEELVAKASAAQAKTSLASRVIAVIFLIVFAIAGWLIWRAGGN